MFQKVALTGAYLIMVPVNRTTYSSSFCRLLSEAATVSSHGLLHKISSALLSSISTMPFSPHLKINLYIQSFYVLRHTKQASILKRVWITAICIHFHFKNGLTAHKQKRAEPFILTTFAILVYGFLSIIVAITIFHIMNTINMGVAANQQPI